MAHIQDVSIIRKVLAEQKLPACTCGQPLSIDIPDVEGEPQVQIHHGFLGEAVFAMTLYEATEKILLLSIRKEDERHARRDELAHWLDRVHQHQNIEV